MSSIEFDKERLNDVILVHVLAEFFRIGRVFPVLADVFPYWPSLFRIGRVCHQYDASRFCDTNAIFMSLINNLHYSCITTTLHLPVPSKNAVIYHLSQIESRATIWTCTTNIPCHINTRFSQLFAWKCNQGTS